VVAPDHSRDLLVRPPWSESPPPSRGRHAHGAPVPLQRRSSRRLDSSRADCSLDCAPRFRGPTACMDANPHLGTRRRGAAGRARLRDSTPWLQRATRPTKLGCLAVVCLPRLDGAGVTSAGNRPAAAHAPPPRTAPTRRRRARCRAPSHPPFTRPWRGRGVPLPGAREPVEWAPARLGGHPG
jgi:hypothetical protein